MIISIGKIYQRNGLKRDEIPACAGMTNETGMTIERNDKRKK